MTSPHPFMDTTNPAIRKRAMLESISRKTANKPEVDAQGTAVGPPKVFKHDAFGGLLSVEDAPVEPDSSPAT